MDGEARNSRATGGGAAIGVRWFAVSGRGDAGHQAITDALPALPVVNDLITDLRSASTCATLPAAFNRSSTLRRNSEDKPLACSSRAAASLPGDAGRHARYPGGVTDRDWYAWHLEYDEPGSSLANRLDLVRERIGILLDVAPTGPLTAVSMVAGQGRDLIPVLATHPRGRDVAARLVELDPRNAAIARATAGDAGLDNVDVVAGDAAELDHYREYAPADLVLMCGLFGNISDADIKRTIGYSLALTKPGGSIIWTRGRTAADRVPTISRWFVDAGFDEVYVSRPGLRFGVGVHQSRAETPPLPTGARAFTFVGH